MNTTDKLITGMVIAGLLLVAPLLLTTSVNVIPLFTECHINTAC